MGSLKPFQRTFDLVLPPRGARVEVRAREVYVRSRVILQDEHGLGRQR